MRAFLAELGLESFPLLSGGKVGHVVVLLAPEAGWDAVRGFARRICATLAAADPARFTIAPPKAERKGGILLDYLRNQRTATAILPWSLRARSGAPVAAPVRWDELGGIERASLFTIGDLRELLARGGGLKMWWKAAQVLPDLG